MQPDSRTLEFAGSVTTVPGLGTVPPQVLALFQASSPLWRWGQSVRVPCRLQQQQSGHCEKLWSGGRQGAAPQGLWPRARVTWLLGCGYGPAAQIRAHLWHGRAGACRLRVRRVRVGQHGVDGHALSSSSKRLIGGLAVRHARVGAPACSVESRKPGQLGRTEGAPLAGPRAHPLGPPKSHRMHRRYGWHGRPYSNRQYPLKQLVPTSIADGAGGGVIATLACIGYAGALPGMQARRDETVGKSTGQRAV